MGETLWIILGIICSFALGFIICANLTQFKITELEEELITKTKRGIWKINSDGYYPYCSECGYEPPYVSGKDMRTLYCSNCGAEMEGRRSEE